MQPSLHDTGLGSMGLGMAINLQKHLSTSNPPGSLHFTNRTISRGGPLLEIGSVSCASASEVVLKSDITFISLSDDAAVESVITGICGLGSSKLKGKIIVDTTTIHPDTSFSVSQKLEEVGVQFVAAPASGASPLARSGELLFIVSGPDTATSTVAPFLKSVMGRDAKFLGEDIRKAGLMKTTGNFLTAAFMEVIAEAHVFAEKTGLGSNVLEALIEADYPGKPFTMSKRLTSGSYMPAAGERPMSDVTLAIKDISHGISCAEASGTSLPIAELAVAHLKESKAFVDKSDRIRALDSSSMYGILRVKAGLEFGNQAVKERDG
ncbi:NAD binding domain of 6-phosphogluconate dehydrogenase-domain-containing protein [Halenospora varia]|nr:NAD binding domain of 6-phosphogluconate dehydrogenase-domain-containing protein [Halenospora varia]